MNRSSSILSAFVLAGLSGCGGSAASDVASFVGTWTYQPPSALVVTCPGGPPTTQDLTTAAGGHPASINFAAGKATHEIIYTDAIGCIFIFNVDGSTATAVVGESCYSVPDGMGGLTSLAIDSSTATISGNSMSYTEMAKIAGGYCMGKLTATLHKQ